MTTASIFLHNFSTLRFDDLMKLCACAGPVVSSDLRDTFAIVVFAGDASADCAVRNLHGYGFAGRMLTCKLTDACVRERERVLRRKQRPADVVVCDRDRARACKRRVDGTKHRPNGHHEVGDGSRRVRPKPTTNNV